MKNSEDDNEIEWYNLNNEEFIALRKGINTWKTL